MIERVESTASTSTDLLERIRAWPPGQPFAPILRVAAAQTGGRGRHGRSWHAEAGRSLTFSLAWATAREDLSGLSLAVGVALAEALDRHAPPRIVIKWPNDLLLIDSARDGDSPEPGRKLAGILVETAPHAGRRVAVIGVGINVLAVAATAARLGVASLRELDDSASVEGTLQAVATPLVAALCRFDAHGLAAFAEGFAGRDALRGRLVSGRSKGAPVAGLAAGISPGGELLVSDARGTHAIVSGEVSLSVGTAARHEGAACIGGSFTC